MNIIYGVFLNYLPRCNALMLGRYNSSLAVQFTLEDGVILLVTNHTVGCLTLDRLLKVISRINITSEIFSLRAHSHCRYNRYRISKILGTGTIIH